MAAQSPPASLQSQPPAARPCHSLRRSQCSSEHLHARLATHAAPVSQPSSCSTAAPQSSPPDHSYAASAHPPLQSLATDRPAHRTPDAKPAAPVQHAPHPATPQKYRYVGAATAHQSPATQTCPRDPLQKQPTATGQSPSPSPTPQPQPQALFPCARERSQPYAP